MPEIKKVSWNASEGLIMEISNRRAMANSFFINGNIKKSFNTLVAMKQSVIQSFTALEREKLNQIESKFSKIAAILNPTMSGSFNAVTRQTYLEAYILAKKFYATYNDMLMDLLEERGYLISEQTDSSKMKF